MCRRMVEYLHPLRGGSKPHLIRCSDGNLYVVKVQGNPQGNTVLINELAANRLALRIGLPVPNVEAVELDIPVLSALRAVAPEGEDTTLGPHIGIQVPVTFLKGRVYDVLPRGSALKNPDAMPGALVFDAWTGNTDRRQYVYWRYACQKKYTACLTDNGHCFGGNNWQINRCRIPDLLALCCQLKYQGESVDIFSARPAIEKWVGKIAGLGLSDFEAAFQGMPPEWCKGMIDELRQLPEQLADRRDRLCRQVEGSIYLDNRFALSEIARTQLLPWS